MGAFRYLCFVIGVYASAATFSGCAASQQVASKNLPVVSNATERGPAGLAASGQDLLYVSADGATNVYIYSYPQRVLVNTIESLNAYAAGECVDSSGDVFVTTVNASGSGTIYEYAHGGTTPIATLSDPGQANGCALDPTTGNLAVMNPRDWTNPYYQYSGDLAVYTGARGQPQIYYPQPPVSGFIFGAYDNGGNLFLSAGDNAHPTYVDLIRMSSGSDSFETISVPQKLSGPASLQWNGQYLTFTSGGEQTLLDVYRLSISGSNAKVAGTTQLTSRKNKMTGQAWIQGHTIITTDYIGHGYQDISFWSYPKGGRPRHNIRKAGVRGEQLSGVAISVGQ